MVYRRRFLLSAVDVIGRDNPKNLPPGTDPRNGVGRIPSPNIVFS